MASEPWFRKTDPLRRAMARNSMPGNTGAMVSRITSDADEIDRLTATLAAVEAERDALRGALAEAADDIEAWGAYASAYFQSKHGLLDCIAKYRALTQEKPA